MFQQDLLLPWKTALANAVFAAQVAVPPSADGDPDAPRRRGRAPRAALEARAGAILEEFGLGDVLHLLPRELSGGMRQRVALARTLVLSRGLVLLDEPFGSLDALTRAEMHLWLLEAMATHPATWVLVTHDVHEAVLLGDRVAVLQGRPARLSSSVGVLLDDEERLALARAEAGVPPPSRPRMSPYVQAGPGPDERRDPEAVLRELVARVRGLLMAEEA